LTLRWIQACVGNHLAHVAVFAEIAQECQQLGATGIPHAGNACEQLMATPQVRIVVDVVLDRLLHLFDLFLQRLDHFIDPLLDGDIGNLQAVVLHLQHFLEIIATTYQGTQLHL